MGLKAYATVGERQVRRAALLETASLLAVIEADRLGPRAIGSGIGAADADQVGC
jgi:hypothetical protein